MVFKASRRIIFAAPATAVAALGLLVPALAQKGIASLNDPCDCMQHHDFWMATRVHLRDLFMTDNFARRMFDPNDQVNRWVMMQSCMYSPANEDSHRPTALSDCIPGFLLVHIVCMQRHLAQGHVDKVMEYATELMRLLPFGMNCMDNAGWDIKTQHVVQYYRRVRRIYAAGPHDGSEWPEALLRGMAWHAPGSGGADEEEQVLGEEADVCTFGALPDSGVCWMLGRAGEDCGTVCHNAGHEFRQPQDWPREPLVPRILSLTSALPDAFLMQQEWGPFECYVSREARFHLAVPQVELDSSWSYPICELACPCAPALPQDFAEALAAVPELPEVD